MMVRRYILYSVVKSFFAALAVLYSVMIIVEWISLGQFMTVKDADLLALAMLPMAVFVIPMALLFSVLFALERLSSESEIIAMKACGISHSTLFMPIFWFSIFCMVIQIFISCYFGPQSMQIIKSRLLEEAPRKIYSFIQEREFDNTFKNIIFYVESVDLVKKELHSVFIETRGRDAYVVTAQKGFLDVTSSGIMMRLSNGSVFMQKDTMLRSVSFDEYAFGLEANFGRELDISSYETATQPQLLAMIKKKPEPKLIKEFHNRFSFPILNLILGLVGITFGIQRPRTPKFTGFVIGVGTIVCYYLVFIFSSRLVKGEVIGPVLGAWIPDAVFACALAGIWLWRKALSREGG